MKKAVAVVEIGIATSWVGYMYNEARADAMMRHRQELLRSGWTASADMKYIEAEILEIEQWQQKLTYQKCFSGPYRVSMYFQSRVGDLY